MKLTLSLILCVLTISRVDATEIKRMVITIDDLPANSLHRDLHIWRNMNHGILDALDRYQVPAIGFVNESKLYDEKRLNPDKVDLLKMWLNAGQELGNHGFAHLDLHKVTIDAFLSDIEKGDTILEQLWPKQKTTKYFRHPFLHTGLSLEIKRHVELFLKERNYTVAPVTIDNQEYVFARAYERSLSHPALSQRIADAYINYMLDMVGYFETQSDALLGCQLPQILLIHANRLNQDTLPDLLESIDKRGYEFVSLAEGLKDPAYSAADEYVGAGGITWLHRWALTRGKHSDFFGQEPAVPEFVREAYADNH